MKQTHTIFLNDEAVPLTLVFNARWCQRLGLVGAVWKHTIYFAWDPERVPAWVLGHEIVHVWQWRQVGWWRHLWRYLRAWWTFGYAKSPYETEAMKYQRLVAAGAPVSLASRSSADYQRNDGRFTSTPSWLDTIHAPFLGTWDGDHPYLTRQTTQAWWDVLPDDEEDDDFDWAAPVATNDRHQGGEG